MSRYPLRIAGIDEVGRGCLAGPVLAAAVVFETGVREIYGLRDSKTIPSRRRECLADAIRTGAVAYALGRAEVDEVDRFNVLEASLLAMRRAFAALAVLPELVWVDGDRCPQLPVECRAVIGGDASIGAISAASILAKVQRDREMVMADRLFPGYGFARHKGYPTIAHRAALERLGPSPLHRHSFGPVRRLRGGA